MLESIMPDLVAHQGSPTKHPERRLETIRAAGELRIPFTSGILVGIGETPAERVDALRALAGVHAEYGHLQEVILQNFVPHPRYYGAEPAEIADEAQRTESHGLPLDLPEWGDQISLDDMRALVRECRRLMPDVGVQIPPNLSDWWLPLVEEGATDLGGLSANGDHISPEHPFPSVHRMRKQLAPRGFALTERLCVYPQYMTPEWLDQGVLDVVKRKYWSFIPRRGSGRREERPIRRDLVPGAIAKGRDGAWLTPDELTALFAETRPEAMEDEHMCDTAGLPPGPVFERLLDAGLGSTPGTAAEVLHDGVRERISPNKLPVKKWVEIIEAAHAAGIRSSSTVMFGHLVEPWELAEHMRVIRSLQERTGGFTEFVPLSFIPFHTLLGPPHGIEEISREENLKHTAAFRLALGRTVRVLKTCRGKM